MSEHEPVAGLSREALWDDLFDTLDAAHAETYHIHASECCWPFGGALDTILDWHAAHVARATADAEARLAAYKARWRDHARVVDAVRALADEFAGGEVPASRIYDALTAAPSAPDPQEER